MQATVSILLLCVPPIVLTGLLGGTLSLVSGFRKGFGAHRPLTAATYLIAGAFALLHGGYYGAPLLLSLDRAALALWLTAPVALVATGALCWFLVCSATSISTEAGMRFRRWSLVAVGLLATYLLSVIVLSFNLRA